MTFYQKLGKDDTPLLRRKTILKTFVFLIAVVGLFFIRKNFVNYKNTTEIHDSSNSFEEDWFDGNITNFQNKANVHNYIVLRKTTIPDHGDFLCSSSEKKGMCAFKVETLIHAVQICNVYSDICTGFVLTRDMNIRLKYQVRRLNYDSQAVTFVKSAFASRFGNAWLERLNCSAKPGLLDHKWKLIICLHFLAGNENNIKN